MLTYTNVTRYDNMPFEDYLKVVTEQGERTYSHSFLKREQAGVSPHMELTQKMKLGSMVDAILTAPETVNPADPNFRIGCKIASAIKKQWGYLLPSFKPQISYTGQINYKGLVMYSCGRLDWLIEKLAVADLKVTDAKTDAEFLKIIKHFGYENQMFNYMGLSGTKQAFIMPYSTKAQACLTPVKMEWSQSGNKFWIDSVLRFGK